MKYFSDLIHGRRHPLHQLPSYFVVEVFLLGGAFGLHMFIA